jgi:cytochrome c oxidase subunit 2/cytochrome aa3-600 menaquinol oxidase subunit 2
MLGGGTLIFLMVCGLLAAAFRARNGDEESSNPGEKFWIIGLGLVFTMSVLAALLAYGLIVGEKLLPRQSVEVVRVEAQARQWSWRFAYEDRPDHATQNLLHIPAGRPVDVAISSSDVVHSFWVPRLAGKMDAIPGRVNVLRIEADAPGLYRGLASEYNGIGYRDHTFTVRAHDAEGWSKFLAGETP